MHLPFLFVHSYFLIVEKLLTTTLNSFALQNDDFIHRSPAPQSPQSPSRLFSLQLLGSKVRSKTSITMAMTGTIDSNKVVSNLLTN